MVFGVQLLEDYRKKGHLIRVVKTEQSSNLTLFVCPYSFSNESQIVPSWFPYLS